MGYLVGACEVLKMAVLPFDSVMLKQWVVQDVEDVTPSSAFN